MAGSSLRHHPATVTNHSISRRGFMMTLDAMCERDSRGKGYFSETEIPALDLDSYETWRTKGSGNNDCTVDAAVGICNRSGNRDVSHRLLLIELRTNYKSTDNLEIGKIASKKTHSRNILDCCVDYIPTDNVLCLIFKPAVESEAVNWLSRFRQTDTRLKQWEIFSPQTFCNFLNYGIQDPYIPKNETTLLIAKFEQALNTDDWETIDTVWEEVHRHLDNCRLRHELSEVDYIADKIKTAAAAYQIPAGMDEEAADYLALTLDDIARVLR